MSDTTDTRALVRELILAGCERDEIGVHASFLLINDLPDETRNSVLAQLDGLGIRAVRALAHAHDMSYEEMVDALIAQADGGST